MGRAACGGRCWRRPRPSSRSRGPATTCRARGRATTGRRTTRPAGRTRRPPYRGPTGSAESMQSAYCSSESVNEMHGAGSAGRCLCKGTPLFPMRQHLMIKPNAALQTNLGSLQAARSWPGCRWMTRRPRPQQGHSAALAPRHPRNRMDAARRKRDESHACVPRPRQPAPSASQRSSKVINSVSMASKRACMAGRRCGSRL